MSRIRLGLGNYYGEVEAAKLGENYYLQLENYDGWESLPISEELYKLIEKEFGGKEND